MKKLFLLLFASVFLISFVSAWSYDNSFSYGSATAYAQVTGTYPQCDGIAHGEYCAGKGWYVDVSFVGDKFYLGEQMNTWPSFSTNGVSGIPSATAGRKYLSFGQGEFPKYILCAWDYDKASNGDWAWAGKCGGYLGTGSLGVLKNIECYSNTDCSSNQYCDKSGDWSLWSCKLKECEIGEDKTEFDGYYKCENYKWINKGECKPQETKCVGYEFSECSNIYNWIDKGKVVGECGWTELTHYRYIEEDNECIEVGLFPGEETNLDFKNKENCEEMIQRIHLVPIILISSLGIGIIVLIVLIIKRFRRKR